MEDSYGFICKNPGCRAYFLTRDPFQDYCSTKCERIALQIPRFPRF